MDTPSQEDNWMPTFYVGQHESKRVLPVTSQILHQAHDFNYDMLTSPITTPFFHQRVLELVTYSLYNNADPDSELQSPTISPLCLADTPLSPGDITPQLLAFVSPWIDLCSPDPLIASVSRQVLYLEIAYAAFCGIEYIFIPGPRLYHDDAVTYGTSQYARAVQEALSIGSHLSIYIMLPMVDNPVDDPAVELVSLASHARRKYLDDILEYRPHKPDMFGTWDAWNVIRTVCKYSNRLFVALSLPKQLPPLSVQSRWYSEPIRLISLTSDTFDKNPRDCPVLSRPLRSFISRLMRIKTPPWILLCNVGPIPGFDSQEELYSAADGLLSSDATIEAPTPAEAASQPRSNNRKSQDPTPHLNYIRYLQRNQPPRTVVERYGSGYQDYLQVPLQPLTDNLESMTYEVFEKDPVKYDLYEEALRRALRDWKDQKKVTSHPEGKVVVAVAGAGRGPLVTRALRASRAEKVEIDMWAVEKNPNAYVLLQRHNVEDWEHRVTIVQSDMRSWKGPSRIYSANDQEYLSAVPTDHPSTATAMPGSTVIYGTIDILVSELLGSFADNELSPECLDGILHLLNPTHGISIPRSYTAFLTPIAAPKLHADISSRTAWDATAPDTPAVVWLHAIDYLSTAPKPADTATGEAANGKGKGKVPNPPSQTTPGSTHPTPSPLSPTPAPSPLILPAWSFHHGPQPSQASLPTSNTHNSRHCRLTFRTRNRGVCHGLGGYFEAVLYPGVDLSTNPDTMEQKSEGMISWFPIFFPLKIPLYIPDSSLIMVHMWRQTDGRKVWYEWMVEVYGYTSLRGSGTAAEMGRLVRLGGGEVGSSKAGGCLM